MRKSFINESKDNQVVLDYREWLKSMLNGIDVSITIGGSYSLVCQIDEFANTREVSDYDFIMSGSIEAIREGLKRINDNMQVFGLGCPVSDNYPYPTKRIVLTKNGLLGKKAELLIQEGNRVASIYQPPILVLKAKEEYSRQYLRTFRVPRDKDIRDCVILRDYLSTLSIEEKEEPLVMMEIKAFGIWCEYFKPAGTPKNVWETFKQVASVAAAMKGIKNPVKWYCRKIIKWHKAGLLDV